MNKQISKNKLAIQNVPISQLKPSEYNPRKWDEQSLSHLKESIKRFGVVDPAIVNTAPNRKNIVIGGHMRIKAAEQLGHKEMPVVYVNIPDIEREKELNIRLNKNTGEFDFNLLADFGEKFLADIGFSSEELDEIFEIEDEPEKFDLEKELKKLKIDKIEIKNGDVYDLNESRLMCGNSTIEADILKLMANEKADMCLTDPSLYS